MANANTPNNGFEHLDVNKDNKISINEVFLNAEKITDPAHKEALKELKMAYINELMEIKELTREELNNLVQELKSKWIDVSKIEEKVATVKAEPQSVVVLSDEATVKVWPKSVASVVDNSSTETLTFANEAERKAKVMSLINKYRGWSKNVADTIYEKDATIKNIYDNTINVSRKSTPTEIKIFEDAMLALDDITAKNKRTILSSMEKKDKVKKVVTASSNVSDSFKENELKDSTVEKKSTVDTEAKYNERINEALDPKTHVFLKLNDGQVLVMKWWEAERKALLKLEKSQNDKLAVYSVLKMISLNKDNIKTVSEIYRESSKWLSWVQASIIEWDSRDMALLDSAIWSDVNVIEIDEWSTVWNVLANTLTLAMFNIDTANVSSETIKDWSQGRKATSKDFYEGRNHETTETDIHGNVKTDALWKPLMITDVEPLKQLSWDKFLEKMADKIEDILDDSEITEEELKTTEWKLAMKMMKESGFTEELLKSWAVEIKTEFRQDEKIKKWLKDNAESILPKDSAITISKDGFVNIDQNVLKSDNGIVKITLDGNGKDFEQKEIMMPKTLVSFKDLGIEWDLSKLPDTMDPIVMQKEGMIMQVTKDWIYVIWDAIANWYDSAADFIERNQVATAAVVGWIIWAALVWWIDISLSWPSLSIPSIDIPNISMKWLWDALSTPLWAAWLSYVLTMIPMQYKMEWLETELAKMTAKHEWGKAIDAELNWLKLEKMDTRDLDYMISRKNTEWINTEMHKALVMNKIFDAWEFTWLDCSNVVKTDTWYTMTVKWLWEETSSTFIKWDKKYYLPEGSSMIITFNKELKEPVVKIEWKVMEVDWWAMFFDKEVDFNNLWKEEAKKEEKEEVKKEEKEEVKKESIDVEVKDNKTSLEKTLEKRWFKLGKLEWMNNEIVKDWEITVEYDNWSKKSFDVYLEASDTEWKVNLCVDDFFGDSKFEMDANSISEYWIKTALKNYLAWDDKAKKKGWDI